MAVVILDGVSLHYGDQVLLENVNFTIQEKDRLCLVGRNGAGKSSLFKLLLKQNLPDGGVIRVSDGCRIAELPQTLPAADDRVVMDVVLSGKEQVGKWLHEYHELSLIAQTDAHMNKLERLQNNIEAQDGWILQQKADAIIEKLNLPAEKTMAELSGGWRRRVMLARALLSEPDLLLLDEPTNHLDIPAIEWLEGQLADFPGAVLFITHDRAFMERVAKQVIDLDRGSIYRYNGSDYEGLNAWREKRLEDEEKENALFDKRLVQEEKWIRQGVKARRTRNEGRVRALKAMRNERTARVDRQGSANITMDAADKSGKLVLEAKGISFGFEDKKIVDNFSAVIQRGDRIGLLGVNGCGKSTLLRMFLDQLKPQSGSIRQGTKMEVAYFDQLRGDLDMEKTIVDNISEGRDFIDIAGGSKHVLSYLGDFLFSPARARTPLKALSGGEASRVMLAKLFSKPSNVLVLDEPTNDLDVETLEMLENLLMDYQGTLLVVSHDRSFLDNVVTSLLEFEGNGVVSEHVGGYSDWYARGHRLKDGEDVVVDREQEKAAEEKALPSSAPNKSAKKLSYKLQRELDALPGEIEKLETSLESVQSLVAAADFYSQDNEYVTETLARVEEVRASLDSTEERWLELEAMLDEG
ncbi:MAG: ATP-binding cassette domain-containing protein [Bermanella sp.]